MKRRDIEGRKIVRLVQQRFWNEHLKCFEIAICQLHLDNGTWISFSTTETIDQPEPTAFLCRPERKGKKTDDS